ncbi:2990_t:CDS:10, partial [Ambispora leptoticha]
MDFDHYVADYQMISDPKNWSALDCLHSLKERVDFSSDSKNDILKAFRRRFKNVSQSTAILAGPKKKAGRLHATTKESFKRREIIDFFEKQDQAFAMRKNDRDVFQAVDSAKAAIAKSAKTQLMRTLDGPIIEGHISVAGHKRQRDPAEDDTDDDTEDDTEGKNKTLKKKIPLQNTLPRLQQETNTLLHEDTVTHSAEHDDCNAEGEPHRNVAEDENVTEDIDDQALLARNLLDEAQEIPLELKNLLDAFQTYCQGSENLLTSNGIMDLRPSSEFVLSYTDECDYNELLKRTFNPIDEIFPEAAFTFLLEFFSKSLTCQHWYDEIERLLDPEHDPFIKNMKRFMFEVLPIFLDAFAMGSENPMKERNMGEEEYMTAFIHPMLKKALGRFANLRYKLADGIAYTSNKKPYEICVVEGSKPYDTENGKETQDFIQNARAAKDMINFLVTQEVKQKRALPTFFRTFMVQSFETSFYRIFEIEACELPVDLAEMNLFPFLFRAVITWAILAGNTDKEFQTFRNSKRSSRVSNAHNLRVLARLQHNKA